MIRVCLRPSSASYALLRLESVDSRSTASRRKHYCGHCGGRFRDSEVIVFMYLSEYVKALLINHGICH
jgi:hypothetical protein